ncbi:uncharacterized protein LOC121988616 isoform X2 [Zingiber officinale]|uniref:uncharacterized protein LOC121988616 isoform X2 n=1 Tax=Zingiber officinale TaxID=94328 RepID=UPI001C4A84AF|nr:uncharacterized protein LOC121988616 isoform X2 [Zingiber officinale]
MEKTVQALGDYTRVVADFSVFLTGGIEGKTGEYCICDKNSESQGGEGTKRRTRFRSIEQLNGYLRHQHNLLTCNLCLEGRKFTCQH